MTEYDYKVHESGIVIGLGIFVEIAAIGLAILGLFISPENGQSVCFGTAIIVGLLGGLIILEYYRRSLYIVREGQEYLYRPFIGSSKSFRRSDIARYEIRPVKFSPQDECIVLYDYEGKKLVGLELNMVNAKRFAEEISSAEEVDARIQEDANKSVGDYFVEDNWSTDKSITKEEKDSRRNKVNILQTINYVLGFVLFAVPCISLIIDTKLFCMIYIFCIIGAWIYFIIFRNYMVFEHKDKTNYDKSMYASGEVPIWCAAVSSLFGLLKVFLNINHVNYIVFTIEIIGFAVIVTLLFGVLPKEREYKKYFYICVAILGVYSGWLLSDSISVVTAEVESAEELTIVDAEIHHNNRGPDTHYLTVDSESFEDEELSVTDDIYYLATEGYEDELRLYIAKDIFGVEVYYIDEVQ
ncbi:hypothetical protein [Pseudobutyrivibrio ruminis]|uniref:Uncharacterized protein n=1 Tax=Pseudobutyrivibrio ruminis DSM 9787 TaxID=1123011 RepID=A0A285RD66_9FIRM|nr:hypothetical protein [Pseudobutyrivibrio ruminis]SOB91619.1 hypothetical protein SAMN02910411_0776 [Pseudobutyrivibrio ruminis DSM 9787]